MRLQIITRCIIDDDEIDATAASEVFDRLLGVPGQTKVIEGWPVEVTDICVQLAKDPFPGFPVREEDSSGQTQT